MKNRNEFLENMTERFNRYLLPQLFEKRILMLGLSGNERKNNISLFRSDLLSLIEDQILQFNRLSLLPEHTKTTELSTKWLRVAEAYLEKTSDLDVLKVLSGFYLKQVAENQILGTGYLFYQWSAKAEKLFQNDPHCQLKSKQFWKHLIKAISQDLTFWKESELVVPLVLKFGSMFLLLILLAYISMAGEESDLKTDTTNDLRPMLIIAMTLIYFLPLPSPAQVHFNGNLSSEKERVSMMMSKILNDHALYLGRSGRKSIPSLFEPKQVSSEEANTVESLFGGNYFFATRPAVRAIHPSQVSQVGHVKKEERKASDEGEKELDRMNESAATNGMIQSDSDLTRINPLKHMFIRCSEAKIRELLPKNADENLVGQFDRAAKTGCLLSGNSRGQSGIKDCTREKNGTKKSRGHKSKHQARLYKLKINDGSRIDLATVKEGDDVILVPMKFHAKHA